MTGAGTHISLFPAMHILGHFQFISFGQKWRGSKGLRQCNSKFSKSKKLLLVFLYMIKYILVKTKNKCLYRVNIYKLKINEFTRLSEMYFGFCKRTFFLPALNMNRFYGYLPPG